MLVPLALSTAYWYEVFFVRRMLRGRTCRYDQVAKGEDGFTLISELA